MGQTMVAAKKVTDIKSLLIVIFFITYPFGHLVRTSFMLAGNSVPIHPLDVIAGFSLVLYLLGKVKENVIFGIGKHFFIYALFGLILSLAFFKPSEVLVGSMYLLRLFSYFTFFLLVENVVRGKSEKKEKYYAYLIFVTFLSAVIGLYQYFKIPDIRFLKVLNWDDHFFRLAGSFLEPGFAGIILVLGFLATLVKYLNTKRRMLLLILLTLFISIGLTYSRASYLALFGGILVILKEKGKLKHGITVIITILILVLFLPRPNVSEGVKLERLFSVFSRFRNYSETAKIIREYPLFGAGYNNMCPARVRLVGDIGYKSHACSGSDSSLLLIVATTGVVGSMIFLYAVFKSYSYIGRDYFSDTLKACVVALIIHSLFVNSMFYSWTMGFMAVILALSVRATKLGEES